MDLFDKGRRQFIRKGDLPEGEEISFLEHRGRIG